MTKFDSNTERATMLNPQMTRRTALRSGVASAAGAALLVSQPGVIGANGRPGAHISYKTSILQGESRLVLAQPTEPSTLDPQFETSGIIGTYLNPMLEHLVDFNRELLIVDVLAVGAEPPADGMTFRFNLRPDVRFWDGTPFDANAVKFTYERALDPGNRENGLGDPIPGLQGIDHVNVIDDLTVDVVSASPSSLAWPYFCFEFMLDPTHYGSLSFEETAITPMGTGPWKFVSWSKDQALEMTANDDYWGGRPTIDTLVFQTVPDAATRLGLLERGELDIISDVSPDDLPIIEANDQLRVEAALTTFRVHIGVPANQPRWQDRRARQALNYAINVEEIIEFVLGGLPGERLRTPVITPGWLNEDIEAYGYDPERAKTLLNEAGFNWDEPVTLYTTESGMKRLDVAQAIVANLEAIGMTAEVQVLEAAVFTSTLRAGEFDDLYLHQLGSPSYGPNEVSLPTPALGLDATHFVESTENGPEYQALFDELRTTFDDAQQHEMVNRAQELLMEESTWILLYREVYLFGVNNRTDWKPTEYTRLYFWLPGEGSVSIVE